MFSEERKKLLRVLILAVACHSGISGAVKFEPGVGLGLEYTDNATLSPDDTVDDLIAATYVGAQLLENEGSMQYDVSAAFNKHNYTKDTYEDQRYFNLALSADWEMINEYSVSCQSLVISSIRNAGLGA